MSKRTTTRLATVALAAAVAVTLAACADSAAPSPGGSGSNSGAPEQALNFIMAPKFTGLAYFEVTKDGAQAQAQEMGIGFQYVGSDKAETTEQIATLTNVIAQNPDALLVSAIDADAVAPQLRQAKDNGVKVVTFDADAAVDSRHIFVNPLNYDLASRTMLDAAKLNSPDGGLVAFIAASPTAPNHTAEIAIMKDLIDNDPEYQMFSYVDTVQYAEDDAQKTQEVTLNLIQSNPDLKVILSGSAVSAPASMQAIVNAGLQDQVTATGLALPSSVKDFLVNGDSKAFALWDPAGVGRLTTIVAAQLVDGTIQGTEGETIDAGDLGTYTVGKDGEVSYDKPIMFTAENIGDYDF